VNAEFNTEFYLS